MIPIPLKKLLPALAFLPLRKESERDRSLYIRESDFLAEHAFREVLSFERKRSERTGTRICAALLDLRSIKDPTVRAGVIRHIARVPAGADAGITAGWYERDEVIGLILSGNLEPGEDLPQRVVRKITGELPDAHVRSLRIALRFFPENGERTPDAGDLAFFYMAEDDGKQGIARSLFLKRVLDIAGSLAAILLLSPLFIALPLLIKAGSPGPVLFVQERIGRRGRTFRFLKFRSMKVNNDPAIHQQYIKEFIREQKSYAGGGAAKDAVFKIKDDPRVTPLGRFLRRTSLDELPQFFNVLRGDMSLVGPRPPIPYELENYDPWHRRRVMEIKPGITGLWQVSGRSRTTFDEMVRLDLRYAREWTLWLDIKIILRTPWAAIAGKGAY